jgi:hypothetical protein
LFGLPQDVQLDGEDVEEARQQFLQLWDDHPHLEIDPGEITLDEIKRRAASFDPLTLDLDPEITAISPLAWVSLGSAGLALHVSPKRGKILEFLVLLVHENGRASYRVLVDDKEVAKFGKITEAVEAVDWEVRQRGPNFVASAQVGASWRQEQPDAQMIEALLSLKPPRTARTVGQALHYLAHARRARRYHWGKS